MSQARAEATLTTSRLAQTRGSLVAGSLAQADEDKEAKKASQSFDSAAGATVNPTPSPDITGAVGKVTVLVLPSFSVAAAEQQ